MPNSIFQQLNNSNSNINNFGGFQNPQNLINQFNEFRKTLQGNPQQMVQQLLQSGRMSQNEYNYYRQMASQFQQILNKQ